MEPLIQRLKGAVSVRKEEGGGSKSSRAASQQHFPSQIASYFVAFFHLLFLHQGIFAPIVAYCFTFFTHYSSAQIFLHGRSSRHNPFTFPLYFPPMPPSQSCFFKFCLFAGLKSKDFFKLNVVIIPIFFIWSPADTIKFYSQGHRQKYNCPDGPLEGTCGHCKGITVGPNPEMENAQFPALRSLLDLTQKDKLGKAWVIFHWNEHLNHMYFMQFPGGSYRSGVCSLKY